MRGYQHPDLVALDEIEDLLEAYAEARLSPTGPVLARMRRTALDQAASAVAAQAVQQRLADTAATPRGRLSWLPRFRMPRPMHAAGLAALLTVGTGAAVIAAPAGSPFFDARVALEQILLPASIDERLASHEQHLLARLAEAQAAAERGDTAALAAALAAYDAEVAQALADLGSDADLLARLEAMLGSHVAVLQALQFQVPEQASIDKALESSRKAIEKIQDKGSHPQPTQAPAGPPDDPGGNQGGPKPEVPSAPDPGRP